MKGGFMSNLFFKYLDNRIHQKGTETKKTKKGIDNYGPIITISRQAGCSANEIADLLYIAINKDIPISKTQWKCVDKKIIMDSSKKLNIAPKKIQYVFNSEKKSTMDEIVEALSSRYYKSDKTIRKTIVNVMKGIAEQGNSIIIGRAGVALSQHVERSINLRLIAPLNWRIQQISQKHDINELDAKKYIQGIDYQRTALIEEFYGEKFKDSMFDIILNCESNSQEEIVHICMKLMKVKGLID